MLFFTKHNPGKNPMREWFESLIRDKKKILGEDIKTGQFDWPLDATYSQIRARSKGNQAPFRKYKCPILQIKHDCTSKATSLKIRKIASE